ncbi:hypothetical protein CRYUN_Cryun28dG0017200 [Craigia yunnanensis]
MSNSNVTTAFLAAAATTTNIPQNPTPICTHNMEIYSSDQELDFEDFLILAAAADHDLEETKETTASFLKASTTFSQNPFISSHENEMMTSNSINGSCWEQVPRTSCADYNLQPNDDKGYGKTMERDDVGFKIAFRTKSDLEIMDDGYKWRKYGKKKVKNSPNPRNYYRCSTGGCKVKKRVERERDDPRFVITTYEGKHNHESLAPASAPALCTSQYTLQILHDQP